MSDQRVSGDELDRSGSSQSVPAGTEPVPDGARSDESTRPEGGGTDGVEAAGRRRRGPRPAVLVPWLLLVAALGWAVFATLQWLPLRAEQQAQAAVETRTLNFLQDLTNWDASEGLDATREQLRSYGTEEFLDQVDDFFGGQVGEQLVQAEVESTGEVHDLFVQRIENDEARVFAVVRQELANNVADAPEVVFRGIRVTLVEGDGWQVRDAELLGRSLEPAFGQADVTGGGG